MPYLMGTGKLMTLAIFTKWKFRGTNFDSHYQKTYIGSYDMMLTMLEDHVKNAVASLKRGEMTSVFSIFLQCAGDESLSLTRDDILANLCMYEQQKRVILLYPAKDHFLHTSMVFTYCLKTS